MSRREAGKPAADRKAILAPRAAATVGTLILTAAMAGTLVLAAAIPPTDTFRSAVERTPGTDAPAADDPGAENPRTDTLKVLFIGNSYTYRNNLPEILEGLAASNPTGPRVRTGMAARGGATLLDHARDEGTPRTIREGGWDFVVLQAQSTFGSVYLVNGEYRVADPAGFYRGASSLVRAARAAGARPLLLEHWRRRDAPRRDHRKIAFSFARLGRELGVGIAPVGSAWEHVAADSDPGDRLYADDGSHPAPAGSYLAAAVLYEVLTGRSPVGLPSRVDGAPRDPETGEVAVDSTVALVRLDSERARDLQEAAHREVGRLRSARGAPGPEDPGPPETPELPRGVPVDPGERVGRWSGPITVYPVPGTLVLTLSREADGWSLEAEVKFGGRPDDIAIDAEEISVTRDGIRFTDPDGPNGGKVRYRGVWTGRGLSGIAEIVVPGAAIYGIGTWRATRDGGPRR